MWPARYWPARYWNARYWVKEGAEVTYGTTLIKTACSASGDTTSRSARGERDREGGGIA